jgi:hypothetical protein
MNKSYLINNICNFNPLKNINFNNKKDIISVSLFKLKSGGYKSFSKYINGLKILDNLALKNNLEIRLFIDNTIYTDKVIMESINNFKTISVILYECPNFKIGENHVGLFGTIVRFFPLFDFENNDSRIVMILDADVEDLTELLDKQIEIYNMLLDALTINTTNGNTITLSTIQYYTLLELHQNSIEIQQVLN